MNSPDKIIIKNYENFITDDKYISKKDVKRFIINNSDEIQQMKKNVYFSNDFNKAVSIINNIDDSVRNHNDVFIKRKLIEEKEYFDTLFKDIDENIILDTEQRIAVLTEEDFSMIVAGAGSGKQRQWPLK